MDLARIARCGKSVRGTFESGERAGRQDDGGGLIVSLLTSSVASSVSLGM